MHIERPFKSAARWYDPLLIAAAVIGVWLLCLPLLLSATKTALILSGITTILLAVIEWARAPWRKHPRPLTSWRDALRQAAIKSLGTLLGLGMMLFAWWLLPEYDGANFKALFEALPLVLPFSCIMIMTGHFYTEWRLGTADDSARHFGLFALGRWPEVNWHKIRDGLFGWLVRGLFLPLNFCALVWYLGKASPIDKSFFDLSWPQMVFGIDMIIWVVMIAAIVPGYFFSSRLLGTHIRHVEHSWFGWSVTLLCYPPLNHNRWIVVEPSKLLPSWNDPWASLIPTMPGWSWFIGCMLILFELIHYWGEAIFGLRASNLSNRGIITNGPYRFCKHPVYGVKCIAWFFLWLPIVLNSHFTNGLRSSLGWLIFYGVYFLRAWIEERLLSTDPEYVAYALWIDQHGLFAWLGKISPVFTFAWRLKQWTQSLPTIKA